MTRPDLEALVKAFFRKLTSGEGISVEEMVSQVAAHERARIVATCRERSRAAFRNTEALMWTTIANELEADHG